jgi:hypothetical protein
MNPLNIIVSYAECVDVYGVQKFNTAKTLSLTKGLHTCSYTGLFTVSPLPNPLKR